MKEYLYNLATDKYGGLIPGIIKAFLFILSCIYGLVIKILILFYRLKPRRLNCKVISVGNITSGGTGKTSLVEYIARYLKEQGRKVAILSRGYKRIAYSAPVLECSSYEAMGDEPYMLSRNLGDIPVIVDADRIRAAKQAIKDYHVDTVILDDGFQQWRIIKDLEIVTVDATDHFGNQRMIPRGILREPLSSLKRADVFVLTKTNINPDIQDIKDFLNSINPSAVIFESLHQPVVFYKIDNPQGVLDVDTLKKETVALFSGIAEPDSFENLIQSLGIRVGLTFKFSDHYQYKQKDLDRIIKESQEKNINTIITTEKDAVRLYRLPLTMLSSLQFLVLKIELKLKDEQEFHSRLLKLYSR